MENKRKSLDRGDSPTPAPKIGYQQGFERIAVFGLPWFQRLLAFEYLCLLAPECKREITQEAELEGTDPKQ